LGSVLVESKGDGSFVSCCCTFVSWFGLRLGFVYGRRSGGRLRVLIGLMAINEGSEELTDGGGGAASSASINST